ncbi:MAG: ParB/RepB/Spo0J family partition protein [Desulfobacterales bacterium]
MGSEGGLAPECPRFASLSRIDAGVETFRITTRRSDDDLDRSLQRLGLLFAPLVLGGARGFTLVSGFRRVEACRRLGWDAIAVRILPESTPAYACALRAVAENSLQRPLNLIEISRALWLLAEHAPGGDVPPPDAAALGLPVHPGLCARLKPLCRMPPEVQDAVLEEAVSFAMACELALMPEAAAAAFAGLFRRLKTSLNKQREIVTLVSEVALREGGEPGGILGEPALSAVQNAADMDRNEKTRRIRRLLRQRRYPALASAEERFHDLRQGLKLGENLQLTPPRDFEGTRFTLTLSFDNLEEFGRLRAKLDELARHPDFKTLATGKGMGFAGKPAP